jgi:hypothetical protein
VSERPALGRLRDHEHTPPVELVDEIHEEEAHPLDGVAIALATGERDVDEPTPRLELLDRRTVEFAVVALPQARVLANLERRSSERDAGGFDRSAGVGDDDAGDPVVAPPITKRTSPQLPLIRELTRRPSRRDPPLVVNRGRVRLVDELDRSRHFRRPARSEVERRQMTRLVRPMVAPLGSLTPVANP